MVFDCVVMVVFTAHRYGHKKAGQMPALNNLHNLNNKYRIYYAIVNRS